jgi:microcystin degradation protein MlrC
METAIQHLVNMRDTESLYEIMTENDDFMYCLDAAEGLVRLGDVRGVEFLQDATQSEDEDIKTVAEEILASPEVRRMREDAEATKRQERLAVREAARKRLQQGKTVFLYKTIYLPVSDFASGDISDDGVNVAALNEFGGEGWEVAAFFANPEATSPITLSGKLTGGYFLLKKEITPDEISELDAI